MLIDRRHFLYNESLAGTDRCYQQLDWENICIVETMAEQSDNSEVFSWLKSLSPGMKLERFSPYFESRFSLKKIIAVLKTRGFRHVL